ncbi:uncharacterized protein STEHIDRAFT_172481 [Stereum hirsutum FP-91666 SS1]|uniref:uncharacterized protein n=1 Tax=Stereum hirsutum (strain FP-91666) TaxID=721885 RepID=UPI000444A611|nr:uncharacterized protein STEHIDRAFT_172481 [Stereum hirsutum FP-91666 SS1]EIM80769.1 hypothetical protein STEHIDRAFT_172481 [Stereum hirsutum FP-91666 SS1]
MAPKTRARRAVAPLSSDHESPPEPEPEPTKNTRKRKRKSQVYVLIDKTPRNRDTGQSAKRTEGVGAGEQDEEDEDPTPKKKKPKKDVVVELPPIRKGRFKPGPKLKTSAVAETKPRRRGRPPAKAKDTGKDEVKAKAKPEPEAGEGEEQSHDGSLTPQRDATPTRTTAIEPEALRTPAPRPVHPLVLSTVNRALRAPPIYLDAPSPTPHEHHHHEHPRHRHASSQRQPSTSRAPRSAAAPAPAHVAASNNHHAGPLQLPPQPPPAPVAATTIPTGLQTPSSDSYEAHIRATNTEAELEPRPGRHYPTDRSPHDGAGIDPPTALFDGSGSEENDEVRETSLPPSSPTYSDDESTPSPKPIEKRNRMYDDSELDRAVADGLGFSGDEDEEELEVARGRGEEADDELEYVPQERPTDQDPGSEVPSSDKDNQFAFVRENLYSPGIASKSHGQEDDKGQSGHIPRSHRHHYMEVELDENGEPVTIMRSSSPTSIPWESDVDIGAQAPARDKGKGKAKAPSREPSEPLEFEFSDDENENFDLDIGPQPDDPYAVPFPSDDLDEQNSEVPSPFHSSQVSHNSDKENENANAFDPSGYPLNHPDPPPFRTPTHDRTAPTGEGVETRTPTQQDLNFRTPTHNRRGGAHRGVLRPRIPSHPPSATDPRKAEAPRYVGFDKGKEYIEDYGNFDNVDPGDVGEQIPTEVEDELPMADEALPKTPPAKPRQTHPGTHARPHPQTEHHSHRHHPAQQPPAHSSPAVTINRSHNHEREVQLDPRRPRYTALDRDAGLSRRRHGHRSRGHHRETTPTQDDPFGFFAAEARLKKKRRAGSAATSRSAAVAGPVPRVPTPPAAPVQTRQPFGNIEVERSDSLPVASGVPVVESEGLPAWPGGYEDSDDDLYGDAQPAVDLPNMDEDLLKMPNKQPREDDEEKVELGGDENQFIPEDVESAGPRTPHRRSRQGRGSVSPSRHRIAVPVTPSRPDSQSQPQVPGTIALLGSTRTITIPSTVMTPRNVDRTVRKRPETEVTMRKRRRHTNEVDSSVMVELMNVQPDAAFEGLEELIQGDSGSDVGISGHVEVDLSGDRTPSVADSPSPVKRRVDEDMMEDLVTDFNPLDMDMPSESPVRHKGKGKAITRGPSDDEEEEDDEQEEEEPQGKRRSSRLSNSKTRRNDDDAPDDSANEDEEDEDRPKRKASRSRAPTSKASARGRSTTRGKPVSGRSRGRGGRSRSEGSRSRSRKKKQDVSTDEDVREQREEAKRARTEYFKNLKEYDLRTENVYVV